MGNNSSFIGSSGSAQNSTGTQRGSGAPGRTAPSGSTGPGKRNLPFFDNTKATKKPKKDPYGGGYQTDFTVLEMNWERGHLFDYDATMLYYQDCLTARDQIVLENVE